MCNLEILLNNVVVVFEWICDFELCWIDFGWVLYDGVEYVFVVMVGFGIDV